MLTIGVLAGPGPRVGAVVVAALAATTMLARADERRALAMLGALVLASVLLLDDIWHSHVLPFVHHHPAEAIAGVLLILVVLPAAALLLHRVPWLVAPLAALTLPFRVPIQSGGTTNNLLVPLYFVIAAAALGWLVPVLWAVRPHTRSQKAHEPLSATRPERHLFEQLLGAFVVLYALQALYSSDFVKALQNEIFFYVPFAVLLARLRDIDWNRELLVRCLLVTVALAVLFAFIAFGEEVTQTLWLNSNLVTANELHAYFQVNAVFYDPNIFGRYLALVMVLLVTVLLYDRRARVQLASVGALAILWGALVFTLSRSSLVALGLGMAMIAGFRWKWRPVLYLGAVVVVAGVIVLVVHRGTFGLNQGLNGASSGRGSLVTNGIKLFGDRPLGGWGSGSFSTEYTRHFRKAAQSVSDSHNIPVTVAAEQGIIGELLYVAFVLAALTTLLRGARGDPFRVVTASAFLALLLHTMLYADFLEDPVTWTLLGIGGALAAASRRSEARLTAAPPPIRRIRRIA